MSQLNQVNQWVSILTVCAGLLGQTAFVCLYATRDWRAYRITRALMNKSVAFWLIFLLSFARLLARGPRPDVSDPAWFIVLQIGIEAYIVGAIYYQLFALVEEIRSGRDTADHEMRSESP